MTYNREYTPEFFESQALSKRPKAEHITELKPNEIFVFGSNINGAHGGGAALIAFRKFGAKWGVGEGLTGQCYALPTMEGGVDYVAGKVKNFIECAKQHPELKFLVTRVGCGIAGFQDSEIGPLFKDAISMENVILPKEFVEVIEKHINENLKFCKYYKGEKNNPYDTKDIGYVFWDYEQMYWSQDINREPWMAYARNYMQENPTVKNYMTSSAPIEQKGFVMFMEEMLHKWNINADIVFKY